MSGLLSLRPSDVFADPAGSAMVVVDSIVRNVTAEGWFYGQFAAALALGLAIDLIRRRELGPRYLSKGVRLDLVYSLMELTHVVTYTIMLPAGLALTHALQTWAPWLEIRVLSSLPQWSQLLILFVVTDLWVYWWHRLQHESRIVWQFHKTHHSQLHLNVMTTFRATVLDRLLAMVSLAIPAAIMDVHIAMPVAIAALLQFHQLVIHSDSGWSWGPLDRIFVSPSFHEVHHSSLEPHLDKNYGGVLSIWDHMFGTYVARGDRELVYGLVGERLPEAWFKQQFVPLVGLWRLFRPAIAAPPVADAVPGETPA
ncbi:sterol desaturase family protein [Brevundimonas lenta]|uniref:Sterol desaturase/sphingolipid hydroxylase (Fatty acid hydroxylase superfamily) n=1 Tax=Brevundimonas lenta TaxID=424796 RepID=A0A7W6JHA2_9CAUL|nr:sterol desaturase family protein [Brevundimonas lenta]MBB4084117.1 sterol desaturase/sphingolipid hydroxylase (fatty acid hydroxylase superfamily) [Brevundimonas lenta]